MTKSKKVKIAILFLLILVVGAVAVIGFFSLQNKEFSFQNLKKSDIKEIAINTREDFYYTLDEGEIDTIYKLIKEIHPEGSGEEESEYGSRKIRLTLKNGEKIVFQGEGHVLLMGNRRYYAEGNGLDNLNQYCDSLMVSLNSRNKTRAVFSDLKEKTVRNIKVCEGISLCYKLDKEERQEMLNLLNTLELQRLQRVQDKEVEKRYQIEKEDGTIVEFSLDGQNLFMNNEIFLVSKEAGNELMEKQDKWLQDLRESSRRMPFEDWNVETVENISFCPNPALAQAQDVTEEEKKALLDLLCQVILVGSGSKDYEGKDGFDEREFLVEKKYGTSFFIGIGQDPFVVNGEGYMVENEEIVEKLTTLSRQIWERTLIVK